MENTVKKNKNNLKEKLPPERSKNIFSDIRYFLFNKPRQETYIRFRTFENQQNIRQSILQRIGMDASKYEVLNVHKIGIDAPANYVFEELLKWNGDSTCWPNYIAKVNRINDQIEHIQILPFGWENYPLGLKNGLFGYHFIPLFSLNSQKIQSVPDLIESDNARYLLYNCTGGYPIGFFTIYVRSSIAEINEKEQSQIFFVVGFDFFGRKNWTINHIIVRIWLSIHNRVTKNVMNRFKQLSEWRFEKLKGGQYLH